MGDMTGVPMGIEEAAADAIPIALKLIKAVNALLEAKDDAAQLRALQDAADAAVDEIQRRACGG